MFLEQLITSADPELTAGAQEVEGTRLRNDAEGRKCSMSKTGIAEDPGVPYAIQSLSRCTRSELWNLWHGEQRLETIAHCVNPTMLHCLHLPGLASARNLISSSLPVHATCKQLYINLDVASTADHVGLERVSTPATPSNDKQR